MANDKINQFELRAQNSDQLLKAIHRFRKSMGLTQIELSDLAGLPQSSISKLESSTRGPTLALTFRILSALGLELVVRKKKKQKDPHEGLVI